MSNLDLDAIEARANAATDVPALVAEVRNLRALLAAANYDGEGLAEFSRWVESSAAERGEDWPGMIAQDSLTWARLTIERLREEVATARGAA